MHKNIAEISDLELISYHEAGHGVLEYLLGYSITRIEVDPSAGGGFCSYDCQSDVRLGIPESHGIPEIQKHILIYCGGSVAESILIRKKQSWHHSPDYTEAVSELTPVYKDKKVIANYIEAMWHWAKSVLKEYWHVVQALADALIWYPEETNNEDWFGDEMEELLLSEGFYKREPQLREMEGDEAEEIIWRALTQTPDTDGLISYITYLRKKC